MLLLAGCTSREPYVPPVADDAIPRDTGGSFHDTGEDTWEEPPWPMNSDGTEPLGKMTCDKINHPCNHQIWFAVGDGEGEWTVLDTPFARHASVANITVVDHGEWDGERWGGLWVTYVDVYPPNLPDDTVDNVLTVATMAFPWSQLQTPTDLATILRGDGPMPWVFQRSNTWTWGEAIVDPEREVIETDQGLRHLLLTADLDLSAGETRGILLLESTDGVSFSLVAELDTEDTHTDPDCYPLAWDGPYPGVLPDTWAPEGSGQWGCHISNGAQIDRAEGTLFAQTLTGETLQGITVTATAIQDGRLQITGHAHRSDGLTDLVTAQQTDNGWSTPTPLLEAKTQSGTEGGLQAPTRLQLATGVEMLAFHGLIDVSD